MALIDTLEHYYGDRDDFGNLKTSGEQQPTEDEFDSLDDEPIDFDDDDDYDDVVEDIDPSYARRERDLEED